MKAFILNLKLRRSFGGRVSASLENGSIVLRGSLDSWDDVVRAGMLCAKPHSRCHVVNDIELLGVPEQKMLLPSLSDSALEGERPDVLIIGGGVSGCSIARELMRYKLRVLLVEKEADLALGASGRNDGEVHPGVDLKRGSLKHKYIRRANAMYDRICAELDVPFKRTGQYACFFDKRQLPIIWLHCMRRRYIDGIKDTKIERRPAMLKKEPRLNPKFEFAISNPDSGCVSPYNLVIAYAENAVSNGAKLSLNTAVTDMEVQNGRIVSVTTNRGRLYPSLVINCAGVYSDKIAELAGDRFFSIHPRRGTNAIFDRKLGAKFFSIASVVGADSVDTSHTHTKGGGILHTVHDNLLVGPNAVETYERENTETLPESIKAIVSKQKITMPTLSERDIITYFTGVRAPTYEEDFIIERGRRTENIFHVAGIQSPGLTTAPAVAEDVSKAAVKLLGGAEKNPSFDPIRHAPPHMAELSDERRAELIAQNPDYGVIVCRCEEVSRGEILDALKSPICVPTIDGIKKRLRPGMGRCQGGFCSPQIVRIIAEFLNIPMSEVKKSSEESPLVFEGRKGERTHV